MNKQFASLEEELEHYDFSFPILNRLGAHLDSSGTLAGRKIGWHCHLTGLTAATVKVICQAGANLYLSECSPATSDTEAIKYMEACGAKVYTGVDSPNKVLELKPEVISDTGFVLSSAYLDYRGRGENYLFAACEITSSGIHKMRLHPKLSLPVININDGELKSLIENFHGVGDGVIDALFQVSGRLWSGRDVAVVGYGRVGAGVAQYLRKAGALVHVVENDPIRRLVAHYDGFSLQGLKQAISLCELMVTATGGKSVLSSEEFELARDGILLMNVGHWPEEIDMKALGEGSKSQRSMKEHLEEYNYQSAKGSKKIYLIGGAGPANVVMMSGSPEPTLIHLSTEVLCVQYLLKQLSTGNPLPVGENAIPVEVQQAASLLALQTLGLN